MTDRTMTSMCLAQVDNTRQVIAKLTMGVETQEITDSGGYVPNPDWWTNDSHGHYHAYTKDGAHPTFKAVLGPCDGACGDPEHTEVLRHECVLCGDVVEPGTVYRRGRSRMLEGPSWWEVELQRWPVGLLDDVAWTPEETMVTVRLFLDHGSGEPMWFGLARIGTGELVWTQAGIGPVTLRGVGKLEKRR